MASLNKMQIIGNLGKDPEVNYTPSGMAVARFSVATTDTWTDKATGQKNEKTEWHRIVAFNKLAENCGKYLTKGSPVYVEGKLQTSSYEKDGETRYSTDVIANAIQFLWSKPDGGQKQSTGYQNNPAQNNKRNSSHKPEPDFDPFGAGPGFNPPPDQNIPF